MSDRHMRFGVVVCPRCRKAKGADLSFKTTKCTRCNYTIRLDKVNILRKANSQQGLRQALGEINTRIT